MPGELVALALIGAAVLVLIVFAVGAARGVAKGRRQQKAGRRKARSKFSRGVSAPAKTPLRTPPSPAASSPSPPRTAPNSAETGTGRTLGIGNVRGRAARIRHLEMAGLDRASAERLADLHFSERGGRFWKMVDRAALIRDLETAGLDRASAESVADSYLHLSDDLLLGRAGTGDLLPETLRSGGPSSSGTSSSPVSGS